MRKMCLPFAALISCLLPVIAGADDHWPQFRGHGAKGIGSGSPPTKWDVETGENVAWSTPIPGLGHSSPIVWGARVFLTTAVNADGKTPSLKTGWLGGSGESPDENGEWKWKVICIELSTGKILWTKTAHTGQPSVNRHIKASHANCTPATDGEHVVAFFGSEGLHCYDFDGELLWKKDFGRLHSGPYDEKKLEWGFASSPIIHDGGVVVQCDCLNTNFVAALDIHTGEEMGRIDREGEVATWSTPMVIDTEQGEQLVCNGYRQMAGYDLISGDRLWHLNTGGDIPVPTPLFQNGLIYLTNGHGRTPIYAISPSAKGDLTPEKNKPKAEGLAWWTSKNGAYMPTPLIVGDLMYVCNDNGRLAVMDATTGKLIYRKRVGTGSRTYSASAVAANGQIYFASERGEITVIKAGREFQKIAGNQMKDVVMATPAISGDRLLIRTISSLVCLQARPLATETKKTSTSE